MKRDIYPLGKRKKEQGVHRMGAVRPAGVIQYVEGWQRHCKAPLRSVRPSKAEEGRTLE